MAVILDKEFIKELNFEAINENIDLNLALIAKYPRNSFLSNQFFKFVDEQNLPKNPQTAIKELMILESLIEIEKEHFCNLTKFGYEVHRNGGWLKYLERERLKKLREDKQNIYEFRLSKWRYLTFFITFIIAIAALAISIFNTMENRKLQDSQLNLQQHPNVKP